MIVLDNAFPCCFVPEVGILLSDEGLVDVARFVGKALLASINCHGNQPRPFVNIFVVVDHRFFEEVSFDIEHGGAAVKSEIERHSPIRRRIGEGAVQRLAVC